MQFLLYVIVAGLSMITRMSLRTNRGGRRGIKAGFLPTEICLMEQRLRHRHLPLSFGDQDGSNCFVQCAAADQAVRAHH